MLLSDTQYYLLDDDNEFSANLKTTFLSIYVQDAADVHTLRFRSGGQCVDKIMDLGASTSVGKLGTTREDFIDASQTIYERLALRYSETELGFQSICDVAKITDDSSDRSKVKTLADLFYTSQQGRISKLEFVKSTDR